MSSDEIILQNTLIMNLHMFPSNESNNLYEMLISILIFFIEMFEE